MADRLHGHIATIVPLLTILMVASFALAGYSFWNSKQQACEGRNRTLDVLTDILVFTLDGRRVEPGTRAAAFYKAAFARIDEARC